jgi:hypothetical protein
MSRPRKEIDTNELQVGQQQSFDVPTTGSIDHDDFRDQFESVDTPNWKEQAKILSFMEEPVTVRVHETENPNADQLIQTSVNGVNQFFIRGEVQTVKRMFIEVLARARPENISTPEYVDGKGNRATRIVKTFGLKYPFSVIADRNPDGHAWLEGILREA